MSLINEAIPESGFEIVRSKVAEILATEFPVQEYLSGIELPSVVWLERIVPFDEAELPAVNVSIDNVRYDWKTLKQSNSEIEINVDVFASNTSDEGNMADKKAKILIQRIARVIRGILEHTAYKNLGFAPPFQISKTLTGITFQHEEQDANTAVFAQIKLSVTIPETNGLVASAELLQSGTEVKLSESEQGYYFEVEYENE